MADSATGTRGVAWAGAVNLVGGVTGSLIGLLLAAIVGRELGTEGAGTYFLVVAAFLIASSIAELGADTGLVRFVSAARATGRDADVPRLVRLAVRPVAVVGLVLVVALGLALAIWPDLVEGLGVGRGLVLGVLVVLSSLTAVVLSLTRGLGDVLAYPLLQNIALPLSRLVGVIVVTLAGAGVTGVLAAWLVPVPVVLLLATVAAIRLMRRQRADAATAAPVDHDARLGRAFWGFSATRGFSAGVEILLEWSDVLLVGLLASPAEAGVYAVVTRCARASEVVQQAARVTVGPQLSAALARGDLPAARQMYGLVTAAMIWMAWPFFVVLATFGDAVLSLFGPGFDDGARPLALLALAMGLATAAGTVQTILLMGGRSSWQLADKSGALVLNVALNLVLIPLWGITGAALAWAVTIMVDTAVVVWQVQRLMQVRPHGRHPLVAAGLALSVFGAVAVASRLTFGSSVPVMLGTIAVAAVVYLAVSWPLRHRLGLPELLALRG